MAGLRFSGLSGDRSGDGFYTARTMDKAKLYNIPGSHPGFTAALMLDAKAIPYKRVDLLPVVQKAVLRASGFPGSPSRP